MDNYKLGLLLQNLIESFAIQTEVTGMVAENQWRLANGESPAYGVDEFQVKADHLWALANQTRELVMG